MVESAFPHTNLLTPHLQNVRLYNHSGVDYFSRKIAPLTY